MTYRTLLAFGLALGIVGCSDQMLTEPQFSGPALSPLGGTGVNIVAGGVGLHTQPASFSLQIPTDVISADFYWSGRGPLNIPDDTIVINGTEYTGTLQASFFTGFATTPWTFFYKLDASSIITPGALNNFTIQGWDVGGAHNDGIGLAVIYNDPASPYTEVQTLEPNEFLYHDNPNFPEGAVHSFSFASSPDPREGRLILFAGDATALRPDAIWWTSGSGVVPLQLIGGAFPHIDNQFTAANGAQFDVFEATGLSVPAGSDFFAYQLQSPGPPIGNGDSLLHTFAAFLVPADLPPPHEACRVTGGGVDENGEWDETYAKGKKLQNRYQFGGQAGAPGGDQPQPYGEWTHHQQLGPDKSWVFHAGTHSAPDGTEIDFIECSDPNNCEPARPAPMKQIDFEGVGSWNSIHQQRPSWLEGIEPHLHLAWFEVHIEDLGEPGQGGKIDPPGEQCPPEGSEGSLANCECPDFYEIKIFKPFLPGESINKSDVVYHVFGYLTGGNLQIHPPLD